MSCQVGPKYFPPPARVLFEYVKDEENEMALEEGEILEQVEMIDEGWWSAVGPRGKSGLFPCGQP